MILCDEQISRKPRSGAMATSYMDRGIWESWKGPLSPRQSGCRVSGALERSWGTLGVECKANMAGGKE